jgi:hypothetical protein
MKIIDRITTYVAAFGVLLSVASFFVSATVGIGALVGAAIAIADWMATRFLGGRLLAAGDRGRSILSLALVTKMSAVLGVVGAVLWSGRVNTLGFMIGLGAMVLGTIVGGLHESMSSASAAPQPALPPENE